LQLYETTHKNNQMSPVLPEASWLVAVRDGVTGII
jgi:hypothetical protein